MKKFSNQPRIDNKPSFTAMIAALNRHMACKEDHPEFQCPDHLAGLCLPGLAKLLAALPSFRRFQRKRAEGGYEYIIARTRFFDDLFHQALKDNVPQIVLLGAGYDTRAIRFQGSIQDTKIFELDAPATQENKKKILTKAEIPLPPQVVLVPINFNKENMLDVLSRAGYDRSAKSFFTWEGVTYYLSGEAVRETLGFVRDDSGPGSTVAFDYFYQSFIDGKFDNHGGRATYEGMAKRGEPFRFGIEKGQIEAFLAENGFEILSHYTPDELEKAYLVDEQGQVFGKPYGWACHVHARVKS